MDDKWDRWYEVRYGLWISPNDTDAILEFAMLCNAGREAAPMHEVVTTFLREYGLDGLRRAKEYVEERARLVGEPRPVMEIVEDGQAGPEMPHVTGGGS